MFYHVFSRPAVTSSKAFLRTSRLIVLRIALVLLAISAVVLGLAAVIPAPPPPPWSLVVTDRNDAFLHAFLAPDDKWRLKTSPYEIPEKLKRILLEKEDRWFYYHPGVNPFAVMRAAWQNWNADRRVSGASTITMQVARLLEPKERTVANKIVEMFRALQLELRHSKDEILTMYLSIVPLGGNVEGLKSASLLYYRTPLERLNIAQLIDLIIIPNDPNAFRPDRMAAALYAERLRRSRPWIAQGLLDSQDAKTIAETPAKVIREDLPRLAPHFSLRVSERALRDAFEVRSTLDLTVQRVVERLLRNHVLPWKARGVGNAAAIVVENETGSIRAYVGSPDFGDTLRGGQVDAVRAVRSPGSTMKPLLFACAMDKGMITPKSPMLDIPYDIDGYSADNYDGTYSGVVFAEDALKRSLNVPMVRLLEQTGMEAFLDYLKGLGVSSIAAQRSDLGLSMILGGCGVTLEELAEAYAAFPRGGSHIRLRFESDDTLSARRSETMSPGSAYMVTHILADMPRTDLPERLVAAANLPTIAFKTGTSYGRRDAWCIGYSRRYTVGVWLGNVSNEGVPELVGQKSATPLLIDILNSIARSDAATILDRPDEVDVREVCSHSGHLPTSLCSEKVLDLYSRKRTTSKLCDVDREFMISPTGRFSYCPTCVGGRPHALKTFAAYEPELLMHWEREGVAFASVPDHDPSCERVFADVGPRILSPSEDMTYILVEAGQKIPVVAGSGVDVRDHFWYLNSRFIGRKRVGEKTFLSLDAGQHVLTCLDDRGRSTTIRFSVRLVL